MPPPPSRQRARGGKANQGKKAGDKQALKIVPGFILDANKRAKLTTVDISINVFEVDFSDADLNDIPELIALIDIIYFDRNDKFQEWLKPLTIQQCRLFFQTSFLRKIGGKHPLSFWWKAPHLAARFNRMTILQEMMDRGGDIFVQDGFNKTVLHYAAEYNHFELTKFLITKAKILINEPDMFGNTPLMYACQGAHPNNVEIVRQMLALDGDFTLKQRFGYDALMYATRCGCEENVKALLSAGADVNTTDRELWTPLQLCAYHGYDKIASQLIIRGAEMEQKNKGGTTPLSTACQEGRIQVVTLLLTRGANVNTQDNCGFTPLMFSAFKGHKAIVDMLLKTGLVNTEVTQQDGFDVVMLAAQRKHTDIVKLLTDRSTIAPTARDVHFGNHALILAAKAGEVQAVTALIIKGLDVSLGNKGDQSPILYAAENGNPATLKRLLECGANKEEEFSENYWTPLMIASWFGHIEAIRILLEYGANPNARALNNLTSLHLAAYNNHNAAVELLVKAPKIRLNRRDDYGFTALAWAVQLAHHDVCQTLLSAGCNPNIWENEGEYLPIHTAVLINDPTTIGLLIKYGARIDSCQVNGRTPIMYAIMADNDELAKLLITRYKADINVTDFTGNTALSLAVENNAQRTFQYILSISNELGVHMGTAEITTGFTPLMKAVTLNRVDMVRQLLELGRQPVNAQDKEGRTALFLACELVDIEAMKLLMAHSSDPTITNEKGESCLGVLIGKNNEEAINILLSRGNSVLNIRDPSCKGQIPLMKAIIADDDVMVRIILSQHGTILDAPDSDGKTALMYAVEKGNRHDIVEKLLKLGADSNQPDKKSFTPMHIACTLADPDAIRLLADRAASITCLDASGKSPLHYLIAMDEAADQDGTNKPNENDREDRIDASLRLIAKIYNTKGRGGEDEQQQQPIGNVLDTADSDGNTILHLLAASPQPSLKLINLVLALGASVMLKNRAGQTVMESVFSVSQLAINLAQIVETKWRDVIKALLRKAGEQPEKIDGEISMIEYSNFGLESQQAQMMLERWIARSQSASKGTSLGLRELSDVADELEMPFVRQIVTRVTVGKKPVFRDSIIHAIESSLTREASAVKS